MLKTIDRIMQFIKHAGLSARQFDISIGASNGYILRMEKNKASIGSDVIENIVSTYPQLNLIWLITGEGEMLKQTDDTTVLDFDELPVGQQQEIEQIIEQKIKERQQEELKHILKQVKEEIELKKAHGK